MTAMGMSDEELIARVTKGNHNAFDELYERYSGKVYRFVAPRMPESQAEDLAAAIMVTIWKGLPSFAYRCSFSTWVYTVAHNSLKNWYRKNRPTCSLSIVERLRLVSFFSPGDGCEEFEDMSALRMDFTRAFKRLPEGYQTVLLLRVVEKLPAEEVAEVMGLKSANAVACQLYRAKELFRRLYTDPYLQEREETDMSVAVATAMTVVRNDAKV